MLLNSVHMLFEFVKFCVYCCVWCWKSYENWKLSLCFPNCGGVWQIRQFFSGKFSGVLQKPKYHICTKHMAQIIFFVLFDLIYFFGLSWRFFFPVTNIQWVFSFVTNNFLCSLCIWPVNISVSWWWYNHAFVFTHYLSAVFDYST